MGKVVSQVYFFEQRAGLLCKAENGYTFEYHDDYLGPAISLSLPVAQKYFESGTLFPYFKSLVPEGWLLKQYSKAQRIDERDLFSMLIKNGEDLLGAVTIRPQD